VNELRTENWCETGTVTVSAGVGAVPRGWREEAMHKTYGEVRKGMSCVCPR
jgi:hypothetical protein